MPGEEEFLELLDIYMSIVEKQDEIIQRLGKVVARQAADIEQYKTVYGFMEMDASTGEEEIIKESIEDYRKMIGKP